MATKKTTASQPGKKGVPAKKAIPSKKTVATKKVEEKKTVKSVTAKTVPVKTAAKKAAPAKTKKSTTTIVKNTAKPSVKSQEIVKKAKETTPIQKKAKAIEKTAPVTPAKTKTPAKEKQTVKISEPQQVKPAKSLKKETKAPETAKANLPSKKRNILPPPSTTPSSRSEIVDAVRPLPKKTAPKPGVVIAHRKIEKKVTVEPGLTMKEYNPSVRSLLDEPEQSSGPVYRYSDEELNEFKELISKRLDNARKELAYLQGLITRKDEAGTDDTDNRFNHMEDGSGAMEREQLSQLAGRQIQFINHLEKAMIRIENKTYGICRVTGKLIDKARLRAVPHATLSIEAKNEMNK